MFCEEKTLLEVKANERHEMNDFNIVINVECFPIQKGALGAIDEN